MSNTTAKTNERKIYLNDELADMAFRGTIKTLERIYHTTDDSKVGQMYYGLLADAQKLNNNNIMDYTCSDGYDCFLVAYSYIKGEYDKGFTADTEETRILKSGKEKTKTKFGWMCSEVRKYIYNYGQTDYKRMYVECKTDKDGHTESPDEATDRMLYQVGRYYDIDNEKGVLIYEKLVAVCKDMTQRQQMILHYRMQGKSINEIAEKLGVKHNTISTHLKAIQDRVRKAYPEAVAVCIDRVAKAK